MFFPVFKLIFVTWIFFIIVYRNICIERFITRCMWCYFILIFWSLKVFFFSIYIISRRTWNINIIFLKVFRSRIARSCRWKGGFLSVLVLDWGNTVESDRSFPVGVEVFHSKFFIRNSSFEVHFLGCNYMILFCQDEISTSSAWTDFTLQLHGEIKFHSSKVGLFSTCNIFRFV